ncbi:hypothetical protein H0H87_008674 [Tephrocybe sp. NHM501043]|nr:hypothetical protein H0H87_008674 [Tephrocybe sp. NHM501043]
MASPTPLRAATTPLGTPFHFHGIETEPLSEATSTLRSTKRKLDDAFQSLDSAVASPERPSPPKKRNTMRSLYSTLAKYGIKSKEAQQEPPQAALAALPTTKSTPHLSAILARAAMRTRKALPFKFAALLSTAPLPPTADYRPSSLPAFLERLSTFKLATYANKPSAIDAVAASKCGWINDGKDRLVCGLCRASWVVVGRDRMNKDAANALLEKQRSSLVDAHKDGCPWKTRQCDSTIYCIPLLSPATMVKDIKINATVLEPLLRNIQIKHPLASTQITSLQSTLSAITIPSDTLKPTSDTNTTSDHGGDDVFMSAPGDRTVGPSDTAVLASLFGWSLTPANPPDTTRRTSLSRANSLAPSTPRSPSLSRSSSVCPMSPAPPTSSPSVPQGPLRTPSRVPRSQFTFRMASNVSRRDTILQCTLCQRRLGLWAFNPESSKSSAEPRHAPTTSTPLRDSTGPEISMESAVEPSTTSPTSATSISVAPTKNVSRQRPFDILKEHRAYCPYVVRSTIVPTLPPPPAFNASPSSNSLPRSSSASVLGTQNTTLEGWRAVLTVVLRYGAGQRQRLGLDFAARLSGEFTLDEPEEVDGVKAMIASVKKRGGKDLLQYVKGLLG